MLSMDYFDKNGDKWSIEKGDWVSHQSESHQANKIGSPKFTGRGWLVILLVLAAVITFISMT
jgi:hypothetical protein